jgi:hypothetical protein
LRHPLRYGAMQSALAGGGDDITSDTTCGDTISTKHGSKRPMAILGSGSASDEIVTGAGIETTQNADKPNG